MNKFRVVAVGLVSLVPLFQVSGGASASDAVWGEATPAEFADGVQRTFPQSKLESASCAFAGKCTAVGWFLNATGGTEAFTVTSTDGVWGRARPVVFADGAQNTRPQARLNSVSCVSAGNCTAVGLFTTASGGTEAFTVTSTDGVWGEGTPAVFTNGVQSASPSATFESVSCGSAGNCTAVGSFRNTDRDFQAFTMTSRNGVWGGAAPAVFADGVQAASPSATFKSVSCGSAGNCTAVGWFQNATLDHEAFTMTLTSTYGVWSQATPAVFAGGVQHVRPNARFESVSCVAAGNCTAAGWFKAASGDLEPFTMTSTAGVWDGARPAVFLDGVQNADTDAFFESVSCGSVGNCTAVGSFNDAGDKYEAFTMTSTDGVWGEATPAVFADGVQSSSPRAKFQSVSCGSAGDCTAVGLFRNSARGNEAFTMTSTDGVWGEPTPAAFADGVQAASPRSSFESVSCVAAGNCTAVGQFENADGDDVAFTMTSSGGSFTALTPSRIVNTRGGDKVGAMNGSGAPLKVKVTGVGDVPSSGVAAVALNVTVTGTEGPGYVTVYPCGTRPDASNLNFVSGQTVPNAVIAPVSSAGEVCFFVKGKAHILADISGYFD